MRTALVLCATVLIIVVGIAVALEAQQSTPQKSGMSFEVASVKPSKSLDGGGSIGPRPGGRLFARNVSTRALIGFAFSLPTYQLAGGPDWITTDKFDLDANGGSTASLDEMRQMLRTLLEDRFKVMTHRETRQIDGFTLIRMRPDRLGPNLRASTLDCSISFSSEPRCREGRITFTDTREEWKAIGIPSAVIARDVSASVNKPISDNTQLSGTFDLELRWSPEMAQSPELPSIYTALQEQLGLRLQSTRVPVEVLVVDHIERPTPD
jgi:uncharacterized protein (TIGR03435 family)